MKVCSECKEPLTGDLAFTEEGQEDYPWCQLCLDYVDGVDPLENYILRCEITKNPCGTDTWELTTPCPCSQCSIWIKQAFGDASASRLCERGSTLEDFEILD